MRVLDLFAGNRAIWFNKQHPAALFVDIRPGVKPDVIADSCALPPSIGTDFDIVVMDPPHVNYGQNSNMSKCYGHHTTARILEVVEGAAREAHRVSKSNATLILKWNDHDIRLQRVLDLMPQWDPLFGHITKDGPGSKTYWVCFRRIEK